MRSSQLAFTIGSSSRVFYFSDYRTRKRYFEWNGNAPGSRVSVNVFRRTDLGYFRFRLDFVIRRGSIDFFIYVYLYTISVLSCMNTWNVYIGLVIAYEQLTSSNNRTRCFDSGCLKSLVKLNIILSTFRMLNQNVISDPIRLVSKSWRLMTDIVLLRARDRGYGRSIWKAFSRYLT